MDQFKKDIQTETGIPSHLQKIIYKGKKIERDEQLDELQTGDKLLVIGKSEKKDLITF